MRTQSPIIFTYGEKTNAFYTVPIGISEHQLFMAWGVFIINFYKFKIKFYYLDKT